MAPRLRRLTLFLLPTARLAPLRRGLEKIYAVLDEYGKQPRLMLWSLLVTVSFQVLRCTPAAIGAAALGESLPFAVVLVAFPIVLFLALLPISIGGLGVQEAGIVYFFHLFGMPSEVALALALLLRVYELLLQVPGAWIYMRRGIAG